MKIIPPSQSGKAGSNPLQASRLILLCIGLFLLVAGVFYPVTGDDFLNYDDNDYVTENIHVQHGLDAREMAWAFTNADAANWHPLTWLSHMLDCQLYGPHPWGHHLTSVLIHAANAVLMFLLFRTLTGSVWRSLFAALLFGLHPQRVESVAWIAERKDVLCAMFWLLATWAYIGHARAKRITVNYWIALGCFALALMSKPMAVTLPFALLLLDYWPLRRMNQTGFARLLREKIPFFVLAAIGSFLAFRAQKSQGAVIEFLPLSHRLETAVTAYSRYIAKFFCPIDLAILYPHPKSWPLLQVAVAVAVFSVISAAVIAARRSRPYCLMGWLWFGGTLVPVIGLVQIGSQSMADRYTYIPEIGLIIILTWGICDLAAAFSVSRLLLGSAAAAVIAACAALTVHQITFWKNSGTLFEHAIKVTDNSFEARKILADFYVSRGRTDEAIALYRESLQMYPNFEGAHLNLGAVYNLRGQSKDAIAEFQEAIRLNPNDASAYNDLGAVLGTGHLEDSIRLFQKAVEIDPDYVDARRNLAQALEQLKKRVAD